MKRTLWLVPLLAMFSLSGCAVRTYPPRPWRYEQHRHRDYDHDHDRDDYQRDRWR